MAQNKASTKRAGTTATRKTSKGAQKKVAPQYQNPQVVASMPANAPVTGIQPTAMNDVVVNDPAVGIAKENQTPVPAASGRPVRSNRNGRIAQLQETSDLLCQGLVKKIAGTGGKRMRNQLDNVPENLPENEMAPPVKAKRQRLNKTVSSTQPAHVVPPQAGVAFRTPDQSDGPLRMAPTPNLNMCIPDLQKSTSTGQTNSLGTASTAMVAVPNVTPASIFTLSAGQPTSVNGQLAAGSTNNFLVPAGRLPVAVGMSSQTITTPQPAAAANTGNMASNHHAVTTWNSPIPGNESFNRPTQAHFSYAHDSNDPSDSNDSNDNDNEDMIEDDIYTNGSSDDSGEEGEGGSIPNKSGLFLPENGDLDYGDERYYPGGQFDIDGDIYEPEIERHQVSRHGEEQAIEIDERSPSEDEREAEAALHAPQPSTHSAGTPLDHGNFNILEQHHQRNRPNRPPTVSHLTSAAMQQEQPPSAGLRTDDVVATNGDDDEVANLDSEGQQARIPHRKSQGSEPHPKTIKYYPGSWKTVLERAKQKFVRHTFINQGFALCDNDLGIARKIIHQEIIRGRAEELTLDNAYEHTRDMDVLVFNAATQARGALKTKAREIVAGAYAHALTAHDFIDGNQLEEQGIIKRQVADILQEAKFLQGGIDAQGRTNNLAHPCIAKICYSFFYQGKYCLARLFPDDFKDTIPETALALVMTCIHNCLDEYVIDGTQHLVKFEGSEYSAIYDSILDLIEDIKTDPYHGNKWQENRQRWARKGWLNVNPAKAPAKLNFRLKLD